MSTPQHFLQIEGGTYDGSPVAICTAGPGDPCHMICSTCQGEDHCSCTTPTLVDMGECNEILWLNDDNNDLMHDGQGVALLPIDVKWEGDYYSWSFAQVTS